MATFRERLISGALQRGWVRVHQPRGGRYDVFRQDENDGYDTFSAAVVAAFSANNAARIHPAESWGHRTREGCWQDNNDTWASSPERVTVTLIGTADESIKTECVILASFHAG